MKKVYFSKSKSGNFDDIVKVRNILSKYNIEVIEFMGGTYSSIPLLQSDILLVLPPSIDKVGRGQFDQINLFDKPEKTYVISSIIKNNLCLKKIKKMEILDTNWTDSFAKLFYNPETFMFDEFYKNLEGIESSDYLNIFADILRKSHKEDLTEFFHENLMDNEIKYINLIIMR